MHSKPKKVLRKLRNLRLKEKGPSSELPFFFFFFFNVLGKKAVFFVCFEVRDAISGDRDKNIVGRTNHIGK